MFKIKYETFEGEFKKDLCIFDKDMSNLKLIDVEEFDSMGKISASLTIERLFGFQIDYEVLDSSENLKSLYEYCVNYEK